MRRGRARQRPALHGRSRAGGGRPDGGVDISGPCDEAEHANDPRCTGAGGARNDNSGPGNADDDRGDREDNSGPGNSHDDRDDDDNSGSGSGGDDDSSGHGGGDDDR